MNSIIQFLSFQKDHPFLFTSLSFWIFLLIVLFVFSFTYQHLKFRNGFLFFASLFFYYKTGGNFVFLLLTSILINYTVGILLRTKARKKRFAWAFLGVTLNLLILVYYKYTYFFTQIINDIFKTDFQAIDYLAKWSNQAFGSQFTFDSIFLPIGISFFTFQAISYIVDVYKYKIKEINNILEVGFFISFFPQLVAGPIVRAAEFIPQLKNHFQLSRKEFSFALFLILSGLFKKMMISDYISTQFVDRIFENPTLYTSFENWMAMYGYAIQIYCDFSGYSDIAIGVACLLGFQLPLNFNSPYKAKTLTDFWHRWHISLSTWLRDYLYIPLGGNKKGKLATYFNLILTMLIGGLWHGANLKFILWGGIHGGILALEKAFSYLFSHKVPRSKNRLSPPSLQKKILSWGYTFITFHIVCFAWLFFRADSLATVETMLNSMFFNFTLTPIVPIIQNYKTIFTAILIGFGTHWAPYSFKKRLKHIFYLTPLWAKFIIVLLAAFLLFQVQTQEIQAFIYFQF